MPVYNKVEKEDGSVEYVEVSLTEVELPEDHPVRLELEKTKKESIERRLELKRLKEQKPEAEQPRDEKPEPTVIDPDVIAERVLNKLTERQQAAQTAQERRKAEVDTIMTETGLRADLRHIVEAISDPQLARQAAADLVKSSKVFENPPSGGNGNRDMNSFLSRADKMLGLPTE